MHAIKRRPFLFNITAILLAAATHGMAQGADGDIVIGQTLDLSGPQAVNGQNIRAGAEARIRQVNKEGGIGGRKIVLEVMDDKFDPRLAAENAGRLVKEKGVVALLGGVGNPSAAALQEFANANKVVVLGSQAGNPLLLKNPQRYAFYVTASYKTEANYCVAQLTTMGVSRIATFFPNDELGNAIAQVAAEAIQQRNAVLAARIAYDRQKPDIEAAIKQLRDAQAQALVMAAPAKIAAHLIRAVKEAQLGIRIIAFSAVSMAAVQQEIQEQSAGTMFSQPLPYPRGSGSRFVQAFQQAMGEDPTKLNYAQLHGYLAAAVLIEALKDSGGAGSDRLVQALERSKGYDLNGYGVKFGRDQREGSSFVEVVLLGRDGRIVH
jgi:ABC-type branched-subunit amino acid transport system substrate-binding protein